MVLPIVNQKPEADIGISVIQEEKPGNGSSFAETLVDARSSMTVEQDEGLKGEAIEDTDSENGDTEEESMVVLVPPQVTFPTAQLNISHETADGNVPEPISEVDIQTSYFKNEIPEKIDASVMDNQVISILEGNKETGPLSDWQVMPTLGWEHSSSPESATKDLVARMPQITANVNAEITDIRAGVLTGNKSDDLCPLENVNDKTIDLTDGLPVGVGAAEAENNESGEQKTKSDNRAPINDVPLQQPEPLDIVPERLAGEQKFEMAVAEAHTPENLFEVLVEKIEFLKADSTDRLEIQLKPEHLGKVSIQLTSGDDGMVVKIRAADYEVKNLIVSQIERLLESLDNKGIKIADVDVVYSGIADADHNQNHREASEDGNRRRSSRRLPVIGSIGNKETPMLVWDEFDASNMDLAISSVEYRV